MKIVTGAIRSVKLGITVFKVQDVFQQKVEFYGFGTCQTDSQVVDTASNLQDSLIKVDTGFIAYDENDVSIRIKHLQDAGDAEILELTPQDEE